MKSQTRLKLWQVIPTVALTVGIGYAAIQIFAAGPAASFLLKNGTLSGNATVVANASAIGGSMVRFGGATATATPAPAPTAAPTPTPPAGGGTAICPPFPAFPDANCTGWQHTGVALKNARTMGGFTFNPDGDMVVTQNGTVIDGIDLDGCIFVKASNVTIKRSRLRATCAEGTISADFINHTNLLVQDVEIDGLKQVTQFSGINGHDYTCIRCNIHGVGSMARGNGDVKIIDSYFHDQHYGGESHNSAMSIRGDNIEVTHSTLRCDASWWCSGAFQIYAKDTSSGLVTNVLAQNNLFYTATGYCVYGGWSYSGSTLIGQTRNVRILNNAFQSATEFPNKVCGDLGASAGWPSDQQAASSGAQWSGNYRYPNQSNIVTP